jgi:hypothetical protein
MDNLSHMLHDYWQVLPIGHQSNSIISVNTTKNVTHHPPMQLKLVQDLLRSYDKKAKPTWLIDQAINVSFSMELYQILEVVIESNAN